MKNPTKSLTPEEAFAEWWPITNDAPDKASAWDGFRNAWLACSQHYQEQIEAVAKELDSIGNGSTVVVSSAKETCLFAANLLRARLLKGDKP